MERLSPGAIDVLERSGTLVTATAQQQFQLRLAWGALQRRRGRLWWPTPDVLPLSAWISRTWQRALREDEEGQLPALLSRQQEQALWDSIVAAEAASSAYLQPYGASSAARRAWRRLHDWRIDPAALDPAFSEETAAFVAWSRDFVERTRALSMLEPARALRDVARLCSLRSPWRLIGFDQVTPALTALGSALASDATPLCLSGPAVRGAALQQAAADADHELDLVARWARRRLEADPHARLLVIVPDLEARRAKVERTFREALHPAELLLSATPAAAFAIEGGPPLERYPLVQTALTTLELACGPVPFDEVGAWLRSPYLKEGRARAAARARLDMELRRVLGPATTLPHLLQCASRAAERLHEPEPLMSVLRALPALRGRKTLSAWSSDFAQALRAVEWAAEGLDSAEHQTLEKFKETLASLASLDEIVGATSAAEAVRQLRRLLGQTPFQPETGDAAVTITQYRGELALAYDGVWVTGLREDVWPPAPRPDSFIPWTLQRASGMPDATPQGVRAQAAAITARLCESAPEVIFSWPQRFEDQECLPSPLIAALPARERAAAASIVPSAYWQRVQDSARLERLIDEEGPTLAEAGVGPGVLLHGGVKALQWQSNCAFRAFAERRLAAAPLEAPAPGIDPRTRGHLVHRALDLLWAGLETSDALQRLTDSERSQRIGECSAQAVAQVLERDPRYSRELVSLERVRLSNVLEEWLAIEAARPAFRVIHRELAQRASFAGFDANLRIDRIDELPDGRRVVIDYKTGVLLPSARAWEGERPEDPQLLVYATTLDPPPHALALARIATGEAELRGVSSVPAAFGGATVVEDWPQRQAEWSATVERLAREFAGGWARVNPRDPKTCERCHLHALCRIDERRAPADGNGDDV